MLLCSDEQGGGDDLCLSLGRGGIPPHFWTNQFPFRSMRRGILPRPALRDALLPSGEAARQSLSQNAKVLSGGDDRDRWKTLVGQIYKVFLMPEVQLINF